MNHSTWVNGTRLYGARRYEGRCEDCPWKGKRRREREEAVADGELHEEVARLEEERAA